MVVAAVLVVDLGGVEAGVVRQCVQCRKTEIVSHTTSACTRPQCQTRNWVACYLVVDVEEDTGISGSEERSADTDVCAGSSAWDSGTGAGDL